MNNTTERDPFSIQKDSLGGEKLVGAYVPRSLAEYLSLLAIYHNTTRSALINNMLKKRVEEEEPSDYIVRALAQRAYTEWTKRVEENKNKSKWKSIHNRVERFREYEQEVKLRLIKKKISEPKAVEVVQTMENLYGIGDS